MKTMNQPLRSTPATRTLGEDELSAVSAGSGDLPVVKQTDKASTNLFGKCCAGVHYPSATLYLR
jgi:type VI protein secretion system component Hcp